MTDQTPPAAYGDAKSDERRAFLAKAGKIGVAAPAAALLLAATGRKALAREYGPPPQPAP